MVIERYTPVFHEQVVSLILSIQNEEAEINLSYDEQPDLKDIEASYQTGGGDFWIAREGERVIGTIGLYPLDDQVAVLKKFFVAREYRGKRVGHALYQELLKFAVAHGFSSLILDTPSVAAESHRFYEKAGFRQIKPSELPVKYTFPDRDSLIFLLIL